MKNNEYIECRVEGRTCYVSTGDLRIVYGLSSHRTAATAKRFHELPADAFIVKVVLVRKWQRQCGTRSPKHGAIGAARLPGPQPLRGQDRPEKNSERPS